MRLLGAAPAHARPEIERAIVQRNLEDEGFRQRCSMTPGDRGSGDGHTVARGHRGEGSVGEHVHQLPGASQCLDGRRRRRHDSITHAISTIERLGWESGGYDTIIRTDSQPITKREILFKTGTGIATGEQFLARNLNYFDAIFFFGVREIDLTPEQRADLLSFVRDDGKGFVATHAGATAFFSWPEFGEMLGARFDEHPWGITDATVVVEDRASPIVSHLPASFVVNDEHYQLKDFSRSKVHVLAKLDATKVDLKAPLVHRKDGDFPVAYTKTYGKGRVFYSTLGHSRELWDAPWLQRMYFEALRWSMRIE